MSYGRYLYISRGWTRGSNGLEMGLILYYHLWLQKIWKRFSQHRREAQTALYISIIRGTNNGFPSLVAAILFFLERCFETHRRSSRTPCLSPHAASINITSYPDLRGEGKVPTRLPNSRPPVTAGQPMHRPPRRRSGARATPKKPCWTCRSPSECVQCHRR